MNKKIIIGIIISGIIFGSVGVYAGSNMYANNISVNAPTGSNLGSDATLQNSIDELYSIADKYDELKKEINSLKSDVINEIYPVGSIYITTDITTASDVAKKFGGTWEVYGTGKTLVGVDKNDTNFNTIDKTGGSSTTTLATKNIPSHNHTYTPSGNVSAKFIGSRTSTETSGSHFHYTVANDENTTGSVLTGWNQYKIASSSPSMTDKSYILLASMKDATYGPTSSNGNHEHYYTPSGTIQQTSFTGVTSSTTSCVNCSGESFSVQNPYVVVYMYKRIK